VSNLSPTQAPVPNAIARMLTAIEEKASLSGVDVANVLDTNVATVSRWRTGKAFPQPKFEDLLLQLEYVVEQLSDIYKPIEARLWLFKPQKLLSGETPASLLAQGRYKDVLAVLNQIRDDVYL
jgi:transcriptional regulator with XRE-family HTH domain